MKEITIDLETVTLAGSEQGCDLCMTVHGVTDCPHPSRDKPECPPLVLRILEPGEVAVKREEMKSFTDNIHPPTEGPCPDCDGTGERYYRPHPWKKDQAPVFEVCAKCKGKKKVQIYYTPVEYTEWMHANGKPEFELKDEDSVWAHHGDYGWVTLTIRSAAGYLKESGYTGLLYVAQPGQGRP